MKYDVSDVITLNDDKKYIICEKVEIDNNVYMFLIEENEENDDIFLVKEELKEGNSYLINVENDEEYKKIMDYLSVKYKEPISEVLNNKGE